MKNPPRGGNIILCKFLSPYANLAYPMTKSPPPLKFRRSRRYTIAPREDFAFWSFTERLYHARPRRRVVVTQRLESIVDEEQYNFSLVSDAQLSIHVRKRQWLDAVTAVMVGAGDTLFLVDQDPIICSQ